MFWYQRELKQGYSLDINITDPGLLYGATIFTTMRIYQKSLNHPLTNWSLHKERLVRGLEDFGWSCPNWEIIVKEIEHLIPIYPIIRIAFFPDGKELIIGRNLPENLEQKQREGVIGYYITDQNLRRNLPSYKTGNYLSAWLALQIAQKNQAQEAILTDNDGNWLETSTGNLWGYKQGIYYTPSLDSGILPGIIRNQLLQWLNHKKIKVIENIWTNDFIKDLELIAYSNCAVEILPFNQIKNHSNYVYDFDYLEPLRSYFKLVD